MKFKQIYHNLIYPFNIVLFAAAIIFFAMGVNNLTGSVEIPDKLFPGNGSDSGIKLISPVEKDVTLGEKISIKADLNPFASDHQDWIAARETVKEKDADLNLEVRGVVNIRSRIKALVKDLDGKNNSTFWLARGDTYKGYNVAYVSSRHIVFTGNGKNLLFTLKTGRGKLYSGKPEIFVAPDIDLYLDNLEAEEEASVQKTAADGKKATKKAGIAAEKTTTSTAATSRQSSSSSGLSAGSVSGVAGSTSPSGSTSSSGNGAQSESSREEEMAFIKELMKIFQKGEK
ncbi:hypothetical protein BuS5_03686 [Desulfosarcina sp. BuS5]|uniref:hypothetical protein n=1 Tax=Desulfosarcina sp. BuS5 TaxID=933262 RepID=UPI0006889EAD|nr:hypothetical protein [Desulfosarcina sp. BuS5]WDN90715.1 hypothetical protein BuS5_03686 [Desulfosarcina sp. BuS5]